MATRRQKKTNAKKPNHCVLCGNPLPKAEGTRVIGITGNGVCGNCLNISKNLIYPAPKPTVLSATVLTPAQLKAELDKSIIGQEQAKTAVSLCLWKQQLRSRGAQVPNMGLLLYGPTGCGKTSLVSQAAKLVNLPFMAFDATAFTETGYKGKDTQDIIKELAERFGKHRINNAVVFIDEIDKLAAKGSADRMTYCKGTQHAFLKLIEGTEIDGVSTSGMQFVFGGAFNGIRSRKDLLCREIGFDREFNTRGTVPDSPITDRFISYGIEPELMGRIGRCVAVNPLDEAQLRRILYESELSSFVRYRKFFESLGLPLELSAEEETALINNAAKSGLGARGLNNFVEDLLDEKLLWLSEAV